MRQAIARQHPAVVLRSQPNHLRALLALGVVLSVFGVATYAFAATGVGEKKAGPSEVVGFANVLADGTIDTALASNNVGNANILHPAPGLYCFTGLPFRVNSAVVSGDNSDNNNDTIISVAFDDVLGDQADLRGGCPGGQTSIRVRTLDANGQVGNNDGPYAPALVDHRFVIWIRGDKK
jgi:hypothetical protein